MNRTLPNDDDTASSRNRVVITGMGAVSPFGLGYQVFLDGLKTGKTCAAPITRFSSSLASPFGCLVPPLSDTSRYPNLARLPMASQYGIVAAEEALSDSGLNFETQDPDKIGVFFSTSCNTAQSERYHSDLIEKGPRFVSPLLFQNTTYMTGPGAISIRRGFTGPAIGLPGGYSSGLQAIEVAVSYVLQGYIDVALCIAADELGALHYEALYHLKQISHQTDNHLSRPFDLKRDGMIPGEGAGALVLETLSSSLSRAAKNYAEVIGIGISHDAYRQADVSPEGVGLENSMRMALNDADLKPESVDYIAATANSTQVFDQAEVTAIKAVFGNHAYHLSLSSIKSMIGETFSAGGLFNVMACTVALRDGILVPTINYENLDPACDLDFVPNTPRRGWVQVALANVYSFGGSCGSVALRRFSESDRRNANVA